MVVRCQNLCPLAEGRTVRLKAAVSAPPQLIQKTSHSIKARLNALEVSRQGAGTTGLAGLSN